MNRLVTLEEDTGMAIEFNQQAKIKVFGVGGGGCNAVNEMIRSEVQGVEFYVVNTDRQALEASDCHCKMIIGEKTTKGLGCGANPEIGRKSAQECEDSLRKAVEGADMVFVAAGMGGGTGTGAAPIIAKAAKEKGILTVGIVTKPFDFEGKRRMRQALAGLEELRQNVDSLIVVSNNKLLEVYGSAPIQDTFKQADNVLRLGVQTITDLIGQAALINLDFADVRSVIEGQGSALIGVGRAKGESKAIAAAEKALACPLLEANITGAKNAIVNVTGGNISIADANEAAEYIRNATNNDLDIIFGVAIDEKMQDEISVTVIATGFDMDSSGSMKPNFEKDKRQQEIEKTVDEVLRNGYTGAAAQTRTTPTFFRDEVNPAPAPTVTPIAPTDNFRRRSVFDDTSAINAAEIRTAAASRPQEPSGRTMSYDSREFRRVDAQATSRVERNGSRYTNDYDEDKESFKNILADIFGGVRKK